MGKRCSALLVIGILSGCTGYHFQSAIDNRDLDAIREWVDSPYTAGKMRRDFPGNRNDKKYIDLKTQGIEILSPYYFEEYFSKAGGMATLSEFDRFCQEKMSNNCSQKERIKISSYEESIYRIEQESKNNHRRIIYRELLVGEREPSTLEEADMLLSPRSGEDLLHSPNLTGGDGEYYRFSSFASDIKGETIYSWWPSVDSSLPPWGAIISSSIVRPSTIKLGQELHVIGRYIGNKSIPLANGSYAIVPVFSDAYVF